MSLKLFEKNIQSQFGEDGVIEEIFKRIGTTNKVCVEFGAWDGIHLSNAWNLWHNEGWQVLLIEGDKTKYELLVSNTKDFKNVHPFLAYVTPEGENSLDAIFKKLKYPKDIDMLSIDIDGDDYYIFENLKQFTPRLILVEYNPTIPPEIEIKQEKGEYFGSSALSLLNLSHAKGYKLAHMTDTNMFFVIESEFIKLGFDEPLLSNFFINKHLTYLISSYDGKTFLAGPATYSQFEKVDSSIKYPQIISSNKSINKVVVYKA